MSEKLRPGDRAPEGVVVDVDGATVALSKQWAAGPTILTFLRHFG
jgi:hypothetical protein